MLFSSPVPKTQEFGLKMALNENVLEEENWKSSPRYSLSPKNIDKTFFFPFFFYPWRNPFSFWKGWIGQTPGSFLLSWRIGRFNSSKLPWAVPTYTARLWKQMGTVKWDAPKFPSPCLGLLCSVTQMRTKGTGVQEACSLPGIPLHQMTILAKDEPWTTMPAAQEG